MAHTIERIPYGFRFKNETGTRDAYGGTTDHVVLRRSWSDRSTTSPTRSSSSCTRCSPARICRSSVRSPRPGTTSSSPAAATAANDAALLMEKVVQDLGRASSSRRSASGTQDRARRVSGGGSLSAFYQQQATNPTLTSSPSGDGPT